MSYLFELFSLELSLKRVISGDVRFRSVVSITLSLLDVKKAAGIGWRKIRMQENVPVRKR